MDYLLRNNAEIDWITLILIGCIALTAITKLLYPLRFQEFIRLSINHKYFFIIGKNDPIYSTFNLLLSIVQILLTGLLIFLIFKWKNPSVSTNNFLAYSQIIFGITLFIILKIIIEKFVGYILNIPDLINRYIYQKLSYRNLLSAIFMIAIIISVYITPMSSIIFYTIACISAILNGIALFSSYKEQRGIIIPHFFYFILYLCALEISPYIIMYNVLL